MGDAQLPNALSGLKGKKVATEPGSVAHAFLNFVLVDNGLKMKDVRFLGKTLQESAADFASGKADAFVGFVPHTDAALKRSGSKELVTTIEYPQAITDHFWCRKSTIKSKSKLVKAMVDGRYKAVELHKSNPEQYYKIGAAAFKKFVGSGDAAGLKADTAGVKLGDKALNTQWYKSADKSFKTLADFIKKQKLGQKVRKVSKHINTDFYK